MKLALYGLTAAQAKQVVIAYEPVWAIGTGKTATSEQANEVCVIIRETLEKLYDEQVADTVRILYGEALNPITQGNSSPCRTLTEDWWAAP